MSLRVMVVCEDHTLDQYISLPVVRRCLASIGKPHAVVKPVTSPRLNGISTVEAQFANVSQRYAAISDLVVFTLDLDCMDGTGGRQDRIARFERMWNDLEESVRQKVVVVLARQETEVWALWGSRASLGTGWAEVRGERDSKERYFSPLLTRDDANTPGKGRTRLIELSLAAGWESLKNGCPELDQMTDEVKLRLAS